MSIIESFDNSRPFINPSDIYQKGAIAEKCIVTFSNKVLKYVLRNYECEKVACTGTANGKIQIYALQNNNERTLFYMSPIGAAIAGCIMDEVSYIVGAKKFIVFGACGSLDSTKTEGKIIIPTYAYRDEGFSYHFAEASDYIRIEQSNELSLILQQLNIPFVTGRTWTTDAIYRETENNVNKRKKDGCLSVEMECAGLQALCSFRKLDFYPFFFTSDLLDGISWDNKLLGTAAELSYQVNCFSIALKVASEI